MKTTRQDIRRLGIAAAGVALVLAASGCGSSGGSTGDTSSKGSSGGATKAESALTVKRQPLCATLSPAEVTAAFKSSTPLKVDLELISGKKYKSFDGSTKVANRWGCQLDTPFKAKPRFGYYVVIYGMPYTEASYEAEAKRQIADVRRRDSKATCVDGKSTALGDKTLSVSCSRKGSSTASSFTASSSSADYVGFADKALLACGSYSDDDKQLDTVKAATEKLCSQFFETVTK